MNPRRLHNDTIFSMSGFSFNSAIGAGSVGDALRESNPEGARRQAEAVRPETRRHPFPAVQSQAVPGASIGWPTETTPPDNGAGAGADSRQSRA